MIYFVLAYLLMGIVYFMELTERKEIIRAVHNKIMIEDNISIVATIIICLILIFLFAMDIAIWPIEFVLATISRKKK